MDPALPQNIINKEEEYKVEEIHIENKDIVCNFWFTKKVMETNMTDRQQKLGYHMLRRQFKITGKSF